MKLEAILAMDEEPFDTDVFEEVYYPAYTNSPGLPDTYAMLIFHYYSKFDQKYGTRLMDGIEIKRILPDVDEDMEEDMLWCNHAEDILEEAARISGWNIDFLELNECNLQYMLENADYQRHAENEKEVFRAIFSEFLFLEYESDFLRSCYASIVDDVSDAINSMEYAVICVMSNEKLDRYMQYRKEHQSVVEAACPEEDRCIYNLLDKIEYPFQVFFSSNIHECEEENRGRRFISTLLGDDGDNYCLEGCVNPNWICSAIKVGMMLDLALEKITVYENLQKSRAS